jgi:hypothetical protein
VLQRNPPHTEQKKGAGREHGGIEQRSEMKSSAVWSANNSRAFPHASSGVSQLVFGSKIAHSEVLDETLLTCHDSAGSSRAALLLPAASSSRETCACPSLRSELRVLVTSTSLWFAARGGRVGLRCFSHSGVITNKHWHKLHG